MVDIDELNYLVLEDLTYNYRDHPCIIDIKMGTQTYEPTANIKKVMKETNKYIYQKQLGFRISGMKVFNPHTKQYLIKDKFFGRSLEPSTVMHGLGLFFYNGSTLYKEIISDVVNQLYGLLMVMNTQVDYKFYCTSLLIIYNAPCKASTTDPTITISTVSIIKSTPPLSETLTPAVTSSSSSSSFIHRINDEICDMIDVQLQDMNSKLYLTAPMRSFLLYGNSTPSTSNAVSVRLVDFAHVIINDDDDACDRGRDEGFIHGLNNLINCLQELLSKVECSDDHDHTVQTIAEFQ